MSQRRALAELGVDFLGYFNKQIGPCASWCQQGWVETDLHPSIENDQRRNLTVTTFHLEEFLVGHPANVLFSSLGLDLVSYRCHDRMALGKFCKLCL